MRRLASFFFITVMLSLSGCMTVAFTGAEAAYNHHNVSVSAQNHWIVLSARKKIANNTRLKNNADIAIYAKNYTVLLIGRAKNHYLKQLAYNLVKPIPNVKKIVNDISVGPALSPWQKTHDTWITTKVKSRLITAKYIDPSKIKVVTNNSVVYLMGVVTPRQSRIAVLATQQVSGVKKIVKLFSYLIPSSMPDRIKK